MDREARSLAQIADISGFSAADVAYLAVVDKSTISRLWDDPAWLDRVSGTSLQGLIRVLPGVAEYLCGQSLGVRRTDLLETLAAAGLVVDENVFEQLISSEGVPEQYLGNALEVAAKIMARDVPGTAAHLMRFWGRRQDYALGFLFDTTAKGLIGDPTPLVEASSDMLDELAARTSSFHAIVAQATLTHHVAKTHGTLLGQPAPGQHKTAFTYRSGMVGMIIQTNDLELSKRYGAMVQGTHLLGLVEDWSFPTYMRDAQVTRDFSLPRSLWLRQTAAEVIRELASYNDAYVHYLATVYLPRALRRDPTFGMRLGDLVIGIRRRRDTSDNTDVRTACTTLLKMAIQAGIPAERTPGNA